jgi:tetraacyldisaccharide 4'-kinase
MNEWQRIWNDDGSISRYNPVKTTAYALSLFYRLIIGFRNWLYDQKILKETKLPCTVISIGNITVGGTGKTPCVIMLAKMLKENGFKPAVLSRGYKSKSKLPVNIVSDGKDMLLTSEDAGDEPFLLAQSLKGIPVITGSRRTLTGQVAINNYGVNVLICDDAFQHRQIFRDINLVLLDSKSPMGNGHLLPRGHLRESPSALGRASAFIMTRTEDMTKTNKHIEILARTNNIPIFQSQHKPKDIVKGDYGVHLPLEALNGKKICAFSGIAQPDSFQKTILAEGARILSFDIFPDHYEYNRNDILKIHNNFLKSGADFLITTEKDAMRLHSFPEFLETLYLLRIEMEIVPDTKSFENFILEKLKNRLNTEG